MLVVVLVAALQILAQLQLLMKIEAAATNQLLPSSHSSILSVIGENLHGCQFRLDSLGYGLSAVTCTSVLLLIGCLFVCLLACLLS